MNDSKKNNDQNPYEVLHEEAIRANEDFYTDPNTGFKVSTQVRLKRRGYCCQSGCRHCPYGFQPKPQDSSKN